MSKNEGRLLTHVLSNHYDTLEYETIKKVVHSDESFVKSGLIE
jgi:hypothetical protein